MELSGKIKLNEIDAIIFDLGGVILNLDYNLTIDAFKKLGGSNFETLYTQAHQDHIFDLYEIGELSSSNFIAYLNQFIPNSTPEAIVSGWNAMLLNLPAYRIHLLEKLKTSHSIFLFSNTNELHLQSFKGELQKVYGNGDLLETIFERAYFSHLVGKRKPNAEAFELVLNDFGLNPSRTLFIDDSEQHILGAKQLGIKTYHLVGEDIIDIFDFPNP